MQDVAAALQAVHTRVRAAEERFGRVPGSVAFLAVSKTRPPEDLRAAFVEGQRPSARTT